MAEWREVIADLPNGGKHIRYFEGTDMWLDAAGRVNRENEPAVIHPDGKIEYWEEGRIPLTLLDMLIIEEEIDHVMFPSARQVSTVEYRGGCVCNYRAYQLHPHDLALAILHYG